MFLCDCHHCGRSELRGVSALVVTDDAATTTCRTCGSTVVVAAFGADVVELVAPSLELEVCA